MIIVLIQTCLAKSLTLTKAQIESQHDEAEQQEYHKGELQDGEQNDDEDRLLQPDDNVEGEQLPTYDFS